jgi:hypothetical protein
VFVLLYCRNSKGLKPIPNITYLSTNRLDHTVSFAIGPIRYEYFLKSNGQVDIITHIARISSAKALNAAKRLATRTEKST